MSTRRVLARRAGTLLAFSCLGLASLAIAPRISGPAAAQGNGDIAVGITEDRDGTYRVVSVIPVEASRKVAWEVLTDYNHMAEFLPSIRYSQVKSRRPDGLLLVQEVSGRFLFFTRSLRVILEVLEEPMSRITFKDVSGEDFYLYAGSWQIGEDPEATEIRYRSKVKPRVQVPVIGRELFLDSIRTMLGALRTEIIRREGAVSSGGTSGGRNSRTNRRSG